MLFLDTEFRKAADDGELLSIAFVGDCCEFYAELDEHGVASVLRGHQRNHFLQQAVLSQFGGQGFGAFKPALGELMVERLAPINTRFNALRQDRAALDAILAKGAERARTLAVPTLNAAYAALGLVRG